MFYIIADILLQNYGFSFENMEAGLDVVLGIWLERGTFFAQLGLQVGSISSCLLQNNIVSENQIDFKHGDSRVNQLWTIAH